LGQFLLLLLDSTWGRVRKFLQKDRHYADCDHGRPLVTLSPSVANRHSSRGIAVITVSAIDDLAHRLAELVPPGTRESIAGASREAREDLSANFRDALRSGLRKLDLVARDEFDIQRCVLLRTREMVEALEHRVAELEATLGNRTTPH
jgi:ubiquinone biosynthesis accessory factor UbiK